MAPHELLRAFAHRLPPMLPHLGLRGVRSAAVAAGAVRYLRDRRAYRSLPGAEPLRWRNAFPKLGDRVDDVAVRQPLPLPGLVGRPARRRVRAPRHVDVGSRVDYVCFLTAITQVAFVDIRPLTATVEGLESIAGSLMALPFEDHSLESVSCLHVAEHIGLGRYGDPLDPPGSRKATAELQRVVAPGRAPAVLDGRRAPARVLQRPPHLRPARAARAVLDELELAEFAGVDDRGEFRRRPRARGARRRVVRVRHVPARAPRR